MTIKKGPNSKFEKAKNLDNSSLKKILKENQALLHNKENAKKNVDYQTLYIAEQASEDKE